MTYGITPLGFVRKTNETILEELKVNFKDKFGQDLDISEDSPFGIFIGLMSTPIDSLWQQAEKTYNDLNRNNAEGVPLVNAASLVGTRVKGASEASATVSFRGDDVSFVPPNTQVSQSILNNVFKTVGDRYISKSNSNWISFTINTLLDNTDYIIYINGNSYTYNSGANATLNDIVSGIKSEINSATLPLDISPGQNGVLIIEATNKNESFNFSSSPNISTTKVQSQVPVVCLTAGRVEVPAESINQIVESLVGLDSVLNYYEGEAGTDAETDQEIRLRTNENIAVSGFNFSDAVRAKVINEVPGVDYCRIYENKTMVEDSNNIPPKSYEVVVSGGSNSNIAEKLKQTKVAGIDPSGDITVSVRDLENVPHNIKFSRPSDIYIWVKVTIVSYNSEENFPVDGEQAIKQNLLNFASNYFNIGEIVVTQKFYAPLYEIEGIGSATIEIGSTNTVGGTPTYSSNNINCNIKEKPTFSLDRMNIIL